MGALEDWIAAGDAPAAAAPPRSELEEWIANGDPAPKAGTAAPAPAPPPDGIGRRLGLGTRAALEGILGLPALAYDAARLPLRAVNAGVEAATGRDLGLAPRSGGELLEAGLDAVGFPRAATIGEQRANRVIEGVSGVIPTMLGGAALKAGSAAGSMGGRMAEMLLAKPATQVVTGAGAGAGADVADEAGLGPVGQFAGSLVGGGLAAGLQHAGGSAIDLGKSMAAPFYEGGREKIVANTLLRQSSDPATLRARLMASAIDPDRRLPDAPATTGEAARDAGLSSFERGLRSDQTSPVLGALSPEARFKALDEARNAVRSEALPATSADEAGAAGNEARGLLDNAGTARAGQVAQARAGIAPDNPALRLRDLGQEGRAQVGGQTRELLATRDGERTGQMVEAYDSVDPEGTARIPFGGVQDLATRLAAKYFPEGPAGGLPHELADLVRDIRAVGLKDFEGNALDIPTVPFNQITGTHARIVDLQNKFPGNKRAQSLLIQLKNELDDVAERAAAPHAPPSAPMTEADIIAQNSAEGAAQRPDVAQALDEAQGSQAAADRARLAQSPIDGRPLNADGTPESLASFLVRHGGVRDDGGEVFQALGGTARTRPGLLNNRRGMRLDDARELAHKEGFIGRVGQDTQGAEGTTIDDLITALQDELNAPRSGRRADSGLVRGVEQELDQQHGLSMTAPRDEVLSRVRDPGLERDAGAPVPDGYAPIEDAFTPEQAAQWRIGEDLKRGWGQDFSGDRTGARGVGTVLRRGDFGAFNVPDQGVLGHLVSSPGNVRQALRAGGESVRPALRQGFLDRAQAAAGVGPNENLLGAPGFGQFWRDNLDTASALFSPREAEQVLELANLHAGGEASARPFSGPQAGRLRQAAELEAGRRADFVGDETGTRSVGRVLNRAPDGGFRLPDERVGPELLSSPNAVRQAMRASGPDVVPVLRRSFMDAAFKAASDRAPMASDLSAPMLRPQPLLSFWKKNAPVADLLFGPDDMRRLRLLASDFQEGLAASSSAKSRGSPTASNLSVAHLIADISHGLIPPGSPIANTLATPVKWLSQVTGQENTLKHLLVEAMADPELATRLLRRATPDAIDRAGQYLQTTTLQRAGRAATDSGGRLLIRGQAASSTPSERERAAPPVPRALPPPVDPEQQKRDRLARKLQP